MNFLSKYTEFLSKNNLKNYRMKLRKIIKKVFRRLTNKRRYALNHLDVMIEPLINYRNGFFIEVGANNGLSQSNTRYFEQYKGWRGLLIEAIPDLAEKCKKNRPKSIVENYALVSDQYPYDTIEIHYNNLMSVIDNEVLNIEEHLKRGKTYFPNEEFYTLHVPTITLNSLLEKHSIKKIDLFSLDVEGYEIEVLKGFDLEKYRPKFLLIEVRDIKAIEAIIGKLYKKIAILHIGDAYSDILYRSIK